MRWPCHRRGDNGAGTLANPDEPSRHRWINLGIVQYIETTPTELKIAYGGGSFGSGFEVRIPLAKPEDAQILLDKIRKAAAACR